MATFLGGFAGQEVLKAVSGKFHPCDQWLFFDSFECLPDSPDDDKDNDKDKDNKEDNEKEKEKVKKINHFYPTEEDCKPIKSRYDGQIVVFGKKNNEIFQNLNYFLVGAGALGCEYLKNFAMIGLGTGEKGKITVTDLDSIEVSNLSRQFLFRRKHVGKMKSKIACEVVKQMNPDLKIKVMTERIAPDTENIFSDDFWSEINGVTNALDNIKARLYVDSKCVFHNIPLIEAGTLGSKANAQIIVPKLTESYGSSADPPETGIAMCTLHHFPNNINHTIHWARSTFEDFFAKGPEDVNNYLKDKDYLEKLKKNGNIEQNVENIFENLVKNKPISFEECVQWARLKFEHFFSNEILQLLFNFPKDMKTKEGGKFWSGAKRCPSVINFNPNDKLHMEFIISASNLRAEVFGIKGQGRKFDYLSILNKMEIPTFKPKKAHYETDEKKGNNNDDDNDMNNNNNSIDDDDEKLNNFIKQFPKPSDLAGFELNEIKFEKDDDSNFHIDYITAVSNLRARNYNIKEANRHQTKGIAGKIIPAMITTTALITGLGMFELYKLALKKNKVSDYKNSFVNIALPLISLGEPIQPLTKKYNDTEWSIWDSLVIDEGRDITMEELFKVIEKKYKFEVSMLTCGSAILYAFYTAHQPKIQKRLKAPLIKVIEKVGKKEKLLKSQKWVTFDVVPEDDELDVPYVKYKLYHS